MARLEHGDVAGVLLSGEGCRARRRNSRGSGIVPLDLLELLREGSLLGGPIRAERLRRSDGRSHARSNGVAEHAWEGWCWGMTWVAREVVLYGHIG